VQVDSTKQDHQVDLTVKLKEKLQNCLKFNIELTYHCIPNYSIGSDSLIENLEATSTYKDFTIIDSENLFKPQIFDRSLYFKKGTFITGQITSILK
jgi:hypothetical protein